MQILVQNSQKNWMQHQDCFQVLTQNSEKNGWIIELSMTFVPIWVSGVSGWQPVGRPRGYQCHGTTHRSNAHDTLTLGHSDTRTLGHSDTRTLRDSETQRLRDSRLTRVFRLIHYCAGFDCSLCSLQAGQLKTPQNYFPSLPK